MPLAPNSAVQRAHGDVQHAGGILESEFAVGDIGRDDEPYPMDDALVIVVRLDDQLGLLPEDTEEGGVGACDRNAEIPRGNCKPVGLLVKDRPGGQSLEVIEIGRRRHREMAGGGRPIRSDMPPDIDDQGRHREQDILSRLDIRSDFRAVFDREHLAFGGKADL